MVSKKDIVRGVKNASYLTIGDIIGRIIALISFVYITRMLGPYDYGIYATVGAFVGFFVLFSFGGVISLSINFFLFVLNVLLAKSI